MKVLQLFFIVFTSGILISQEESYNPATLYFKDGTISKKIGQVVNHGYESFRYRDETNNEFGSISASKLDSVVFESGIIKKVFEVYSILELGQTRSYFTEPLLKGDKLDLYYIKASLGWEFYAIKRKSELQPTAIFVKSIKKSKKRLLSYFSDCSMICELIESDTYTRFKSDYIKMVEFYNKNCSE